MEQQRAGPHADSQRDARLSRARRSSDERPSSDPGFAPRPRLGRTLGGRGGAGRLAAGVLVVVAALVGDRRSVAQYSDVLAPCSVESMRSFIRGRMGQGTWRQMSEAITPGCSEYVVTPVPLKPARQLLGVQHVGELRDRVLGQAGPAPVGWRTASKSMPVAAECASLATVTMRAGALCRRRSSSSSVNRKGPR